MITDTLGRVDVGYGEEDEVESRARQLTISDARARLPWISAEEIDNLKRLPYQAYLKTVHWRYVRRMAFRIHGRYCQACRVKNKPLDVHHRTYRHVGEEGAHLGDLMVLCRSCHDGYHKKSPLRWGVENAEFIADLAAAIADKTRRVFDGRVEAALRDPNILIHLVEPSSEPAHSPSAVEMVESVPVICENFTPITQTDIDAAVVEVAEQKAKAAKLNASVVPQ